MRLEMWGRGRVGFSLTENHISNNPRPQSKEAEIMAKRGFHGDSTTAQDLMLCCPILREPVEERTKPKDETFISYYC